MFAKTSKVEEHLKVLFGVGCALKMYKNLSKQQEEKQKIIRTTLALLILLFSHEVTTVPCRGAIDLLSIIFYAFFASKP